jgi:ribosomal-protein-serine acetyltransferase
LFEERYAGEYFALLERNRSHLREWMPWATYEGSLEEAKVYMKQTLLRFDNNEEGQFGIWYQNRLVGAFGYPQLDWVNRKVEIAYWIDGSLQGKGLVTKVCRAMVSYAFDQYHLNKVEILCATHNTRSRAIAERLGFTQEGIIRQGERFHDHYSDLVL